VYLPGRLNFVLAILQEEIKGGQLMMSLIGVIGVNLFF